jgi:hypothetical protein
MPNFSVPRSRGAVVLAAAAVLAVSAGSGAVAGSLITGADIKDRSIEAQDLQRGSVTTTKVENRTLRLKDLSSEVTAKLGVQGPAGAKGEKGDKGDKGDKGEKGDKGNSSITQVADLNGLWRARATDTAGLKMTGDGIAFGPFVNGGGCTTPGTDYARLDFSGLNGQALSSLDNLVYYARYLADADTGGIGSPYLRVFFGSGTDRLTFSPNTQFNKPSNYDIGEGEFHEWVVTSGTARFNDDAGSNPAGEAPWASFMAAHGAKPITNINITMGCTAGANLSGLLRWAEVNNQTYKFGS